MAFLNRIFGSGGAGRPAGAGGVGGGGGGGGQDPMNPFFHMLAGGGDMMGLGAPAPTGPFKQKYRCYPVVMMANKGNLESGDKIILPSSALEQLARLRVTYPMMFSLVNPQSPKQSHTHCGVMEFSAEEGTCYIPYWMMQNLLLESGAIIEVKNVSLKKGSYVKFQPHSHKFTQLHNPRVVLERALRNFSCLTKGDTIAIQHGSENFYLDVVEVKPNDAVSIIETDMNVDFEPAKDAPSYTPAAAAASASSAASSSSAHAMGDYLDVPSSNLTAPKGVTAADRDFSSGGWGSSGTEEDTKEVTHSTPSKSGSDYFAKLGSGNKLSGKRKASGGGSAASSAQPSPSPSPSLGPTSSLSASPSLTSLSPLRPSTSSSSLAVPSGIARPQSALAGRAGGYSLNGRSPAPASPATSSSSSLPARPTSATPSLSASASSSGLSLAPSAGSKIVIERQGKFDYHYSVDEKGVKKLVRRLPAKDTPAPAAAAAAPTSASATPAAPASGLAALGPGHRLK